MTENCFLAFGVTSIYIASLKAYISIYEGVAGGGLLFGIQ